MKHNPSLNPLSSQFRWICEIAGMKEPRRLIHVGLSIEPARIGHGIVTLSSALRLRCDDAESDAWADPEACRHLGIRSILAAPVLYERDLVGLLEVFSTRPCAFDDGDLAVVERLAQTVVLTLSKAEALQRD
jgi:GAF domain-containing protein